LHSAFCSCARGSPFTQAFNQSPGCSQLRFVKGVIGVVRLAERLEGNRIWASACSAMVKITSSLCENPQRHALITSTRGPLKRHPRAGPFLQRRPVGGDGLLQPRRPDLRLAEAWVKASPAMIATDELLELARSTAARLGVPVATDAEVMRNACAGRKNRHRVFQAAADRGGSAMSFCR
jgi:hypothetical protein